MTSRFRCPFVALSIALLVLAAGASAQSPGSQKTRAVQSAVASGSQATPEERGKLAHQFVSKWGVYVQRVYGVRVGTWAQRMVPNFATADAANFRSAVQRDTFEGAMAELSGSGHKVSDSRVITQLASMERASASSIAGITPMTLGALSNDLVYTPVAPCRILDTRSTAGGQIAANGTRSFVAFSASTFTFQGGSATNCGTLSTGLSATAVAINLTAVTPVTAGFATVYPFGTPQPLAASVNYAAGSIVNNALIAQIPNPLAASDFTIFTFAQSHFVADIVGYFAPPFATALQCTNTAVGVTAVAAGATANSFAPLCPTGYTQTATNCESSSFQMPFVFSSGGTCSAQNNSAASADLRSSRTCCRVPGR